MPSEPISRHARDPALDGLRGLAVLMVFLYHYGGGLQSQHLLVHLFGLATAAGWTGIVLFFVLSGYLITGTLWDAFPRPHAVWHFYARRALRIFPLYYAVLFIVLLASLMRGASFHELRPLGIFFLFLQDVPGLASQAILNPSPLPLYHLWTLAVEEQFYLLWPLLPWIALRNRQSSPVTPLRRALDLCLSLFVLSALFRLAIYAMIHAGNTLLNGLFDDSLLTHVGALALGAALALALRDPELAHRIRGLASPFLAIGLIAYIASSALCDSPLLRAPVQYIVGLPALSLAAVGLIALLRQPGPLRSAAAFTPLRWVGRIGYGVYIFHILLQPVFDAIALHYAHRDTGTAYHAIRFAAGLPITLLVSWLSFYLFETPFLQLKRHFPMHEAPVIP
jgi:peptidoglycan/LPS O-acetylase OafA/YrhL